MQKALPLLISALLLCHASASNSIPDQLVGEWRNSTTSTNFDEIDIAPDGTGYLGGEFQGDGKFYETKLVYNPSNHVLTITAQGQGIYNDGKRYISQFGYNSITKTMTKVKGDWGGKLPFVHPPEKFLVPKFTLSPDGRYGVTIPVFYFDDLNDPSNNLIEVKTGRVLTTINADPGYDRALNFHEVLPSRWSNDSSLLLWEVAGKWNPDALVLLKIKNGKTAWQLDLLKISQQAILTRTKQAAPKTYLAVKGDGSEYGSAYPDGFTVDVSVPENIHFPLLVHADLTANPKGIENFSHNLDSQLDGIVDENGKFTVIHFELTARKDRD